MADKKEESNSASQQQKLSSFHKPGWNDPPPLSVASKETSASPVRKRLLNKRIAFPLNSNSSPNGVVQNLPSDLPLFPSVSEPMTLVSEIPENLKEISKETAPVSTLENLNNVTDNSTHLENKAENIKKTFDVTKS